MANTSASILVFLYSISTIPTESSDFRHLQRLQSCLILLILSKSQHAVEAQNRIKTIDLGVRKSEFAQEKRKIHPSLFAVGMP